MASRLEVDIDSPTLGQRFGVGQFTVVPGSADVRHTRLPTFIITGVDVASGAGDGAPPGLHHLRRLRSVRAPFLWG